LNKGQGIAALGHLRILDLPGGKRVSDGKIGLYILDGFCPGPGGLNVYLVYGGLYNRFFHIRGKNMKVFRIVKDKFSCGTQYNAPLKQFRLIIPYNGKIVKGFFYGVSGFAYLYNLFPGGCPGRFRGFQGGIAYIGPFLPDKLFYFNLETIKELFIVLINKNLYKVLAVVFFYNFLRLTADISPGDIIRAFWA
jgi:hypothetical protein